MRQLSIALLCVAAATQVDAQDRPGTPTAAAVTVDVTTVYFWRARREGAPRVEVVGSRRISTAPGGTATSEVASHDAKITVGLRPTTGAPQLDIRFSYSRRGHHMSNSLGTTWSGKPEIRSLMGNLDGDGDGMHWLHFIDGILLEPVDSPEKPFVPITDPAQLAARLVDRFIATAGSPEERHVVPDEDDIPEMDQPGMVIVGRSSSAGSWPRRASNLLCRMPLGQLLDPERLASFNGFATRSLKQGATGLRHVVLPVAIACGTPGALDLVPAPGVRDGRIRDALRIAHDAAITPSDRGAAGWLLFETNPGASTRMLADELESGAAVLASEPGLATERANHVRELAAHGRVTMAIVTLGSGVLLLLGMVTGLRALLRRLIAA